jgi:hypothetical protein
MRGAEGLQASTAAAADVDVAGASEVAPKWQLMEASLGVVLSQLQTVMPMALPQRLRLIRAEDLPFSKYPQQTVGGHHSTFYPRKGMVREDLITCTKVDIPLEPCSLTE